ncbi:8511_t:CDS:1 [Paraglomus occultum]|uniref:8511_t:CDS:1 n=1 Tax=Paraglomus occultum TaxID=144539 RepID=A0A9N9FWT7_9GLOM|nr:8511_t:CDS:1 [Paraglomus occultum]
MPSSPARRQEQRLQSHENGARFRPNPFLAYRQAIAAMTPGPADQQTISIRAAEMWHAASNEERALYDVHAEFRAEILNSSYHCPQNLGKNSGLVMLTEWQGDNFFMVKILPRQEESGSSGNGQ